MFQVRYYDYVNKDPFMKEYESSVFDYVRGLEQLQACYAALSKNVKITDSFVSNVDNLNPELSEIKRAHLDAKDRVQNNFKQYYVVSHDLVQNFEKEFDCMKKISDIKRAKFKEYALKSYKEVLPIELYNKVINNHDYKMNIGRLLQCYTKCQHLCDSRNVFVKSIQYQLNALYSLEKDLVDEFKHMRGNNDPMRGTGSNDLVENISSQLHYFNDLIKECEQLDNQLKGGLLRNINSMQGRYRKDNRMDPNFYKHYLGNGTWDELLGSYDKTTRALSHEITNQQKELDYLNDRDQKEYRKNVHIFSNPRVVSLASEKASMIDLMGDKKEKNQIMLTELEECMLKNGEDLGICVKHLEGVQKNDRSKVDTYIDSIERHEKSGKLYTELYIALKKEREFIDREITSRKIEKAMSSQTQEILKRQEQMRKLQDQMNLHAGKIKNYQSLMHENLKDAPRRPGEDPEDSQLNKYLLRQQTTNNNRFAAAVKNQNNSSLVNSNIRHSEVPSVRYYNDLKDSWKTHTANLYDNNENFSVSNLSPKGDMTLASSRDLTPPQLDDMFKVQSGGDGLTGFLDYGFMKDRNVIVGLHTLKTFLHEKKKKEIEKLSPYDRTEAKLLLIDLALSKFYETKVYELIGGKGNLYKIEDFVRDKCDRVNYDNIVQNIEYHKGSVYPLVHYMTNYLRKQMDIIRAYNDRIYDYAMKLTSKGVEFKYNGLVSVQIKEFISTYTNVNKLKNFNDPYYKVRYFLGVNSIGEHSLPHQLTVAIDNYNREFESIRKTVIRNEDSNEIVGYGKGNSKRPNSYYHLSNEAFDGHMEKVNKLNEMFKNHRDVSKNIITKLTESFNAISKIKHLLDYHHINHELFQLEQKNDDKKLEDFQIMDVRNKVDTISHNLLDYLKLKTKICMDKKVTLLKQQECHRLLKDNTLDMVAYASKLNTIEKVFKDNMIIDKFEKINDKIGTLNKWQLSQDGDHDYGVRRNRLNTKLLELRDLVSEKQHLTDFLLQNGARYDEHSARHSGIRQIILDLNHRIHLANYRDFAVNSTNRCNIDENINKMKTKLLAVKSHFITKSTTYLNETEDNKQLKGYVENMLQIIDNAFDMCAIADKLCNDAHHEYMDLGVDLDTTNLNVPLPDIGTKYVDCSEEHPKFVSSHSGTHGAPLPINNGILDNSLLRTTMGIGGPTGGPSAPGVPLAATTSDPTGGPSAPGATQPGSQSQLSSSSSYSSSSSSNNRSVPISSSSNNMSVPSFRPPKPPKPPGNVPNITRQTQSDHNPPDSNSNSSAQFLSAQSF
jgi:hypothetical protein